MGFLYHLVMRYIDSEKLTKIIEERKAQQDQWVNSYHDPINQGISQELTEILSIIASLRQEQPEYGYLSTMYIDGKKARWNVGDTIAYYLCTSDEEGEIPLGKITKVDFNDDEGWVYTFEDESMWAEEDLYKERAYQIIENGK